MITANCLVANKLVKNFGSNSLVVYHPKPSAQSIGYLNDAISDFGYKFTGNDLQSLEKEMKKLFSDEGINDEFKEILIHRAI